ncbi:hypothetical protein H4R35_007428 [Dimargaris xerosporica]|nr:hypothetical protein H4R35_007428 [Dimargaris xerosporica]
MLGIGTPKPARAPAKAAPPPPTTTSPAASRNAVANDLLRQFQAASPPSIGAVKGCACPPSAQPQSIQSLMNRLTATPLAAPGAASTNATPAHGATFNATSTSVAALPPVQASAPPTTDAKSKSLLDLFQRAKVPTAQSRSTAPQPPPVSQLNPMEQFEFDRALLENSFQQLKSS